MEQWYLLGSPKVVVEVEGIKQLLEVVKHAEELGLEMSKDYFRTIIEDPYIRQDEDSLFKSMAVGFAPLPEEIVNKLCAAI